MRSHRIALFSEESGFYKYVLEGLGRGFIALGHQCVWATTLPKHDQLAHWVQQNEITLVLEINRVLPRDQTWPKGVAHACWLQDYRWHDADLTADLGKSDHIYFLLHPKGFGLEMPAGGRWSVLSPGARPDAPAPVEQTDTCDFSFCGFIPRPVSPDETVAIGDDGRSISVQEFTKDFPPHVLAQSHFLLGDINREIDRTCERLKCRLVDAHASKRSGRMIIDEDLVRTGERSRVVAALLLVSQDLRIYGTPKWTGWPEFAPYYRGNIPDPMALDTIYQATRVNIHNGVLSMHFRVMDCLAAGGFLMINKTILDDEVGGINRSFAAGVHYGGYEIENTAEAARRYLEDPQLRHKISTEGRRAVLAARAWNHRAAQILKDFEIH